MTSHPARRRRRRTLAAALAALLLAAVPTAAAAHVTVQPSTVEGGGYAVVALRVPNERDDASTTRVRVLLPTEQPLASVRTTPVPGWRVTTRSRELDEPLDLHGTEVSSVVAEVTWTATTRAGVGPDQFQDFELSLGPLPESGELVLTTQQTYSSGERVDWNQVAVDDAVEPERPAPVLTLTAATGSAGTPRGTGVASAEEPSAGEPPGEQPSARQPDDEPAAGTDQGSTASPVALPVALAGTSLVVALAALALAWTARRRRPGA